MEVLARKPSKPSSNVSEIAYRFAKLCRLRSLGVFPNKKLQQGSKSTEETQRGEPKIHPQPQPVKEKLIRSSGNEAEVVAVLMLKLFDTISTLKLAYIQLQKSHFPYNPDSIQAADELIVSELETLCEIKKSYKKVTKPNSKSTSTSTFSLSGSSVLEFIQDKEIQLENVQCQVEAKDAEILSLENELHERDAENDDLSEKIKQNWFRDAFKEASKAIHDFAKPLISLMKASSWDLDQAANSIENSVMYSKRSHKKYAFEAYISRRMFNEFSLQDDITTTKYAADPPLDALIKYPNSNFAKFCRLKYLLVVHPKLEMSFFGNLDHRRLISQGGHPRTSFYQLFVKMAKWVWVLGVIGGSVEPKVEIFRVERGSDFSEDYMENVVDDDDHHHHYTVGMMVMPGFKSGSSVIKSRVYLSRFLGSTAGSL